MVTAVSAGVATYQRPDGLWAWLGGLQNLTFAQAEFAQAEEPQ